LEKSPLQTVKRLDADSFKERFKLMKNGEHLKKSGLGKISSYAEF